MGVIIIITQSLHMHYNYNRVHSSTHSIRLQSVQTMCDQECTYMYKYNEDVTKETVCTHGGIMEYKTKDQSCTEFEVVQYGAGIWSSKGHVMSNVIFNISIPKGKPCFLK